MRVESIDNPAPVAQVIDSWRHTAEVLADPELAAVLSAPVTATMARGHGAGRARVGAAQAQ